MNRKAKDMVARAAKEAGVTVDEVTESQRHILVKVSRGDKRGMVTIGRSPSDHRYFKNTVMYMKEVTS